jgi:hypothetical protein
LYVSIYTTFNINLIDFTPGAWDIPLLYAGIMLKSTQSVGGNTVYIDSITGTSNQTVIVGKIPTTPSNVQALQTSLNSLL